jgi:predicted Zn-dependent protease
VTTEGTYPALFGRKGGLLSINLERMEFRSDDTPEVSFSISISNIEVSLEGANSHHFRLTDRLQRANSVVIQEITPVLELAKRGNQSAQEISDRAKSKTRIRAALASSPIVLTVFLLLAVPALISFIPMSWLNGALTHKQERKIGLMMLPVLTPNPPPAAEAVEAKNLLALRKLAGYIQNANSSLKDIEFDIHISPSPDINAFALPGGIVVMNQGLLEKAETVEEVAGVLAHEMAHVERRHTFKSLANRLGYLGGLVLLSTLIGADAAIVIAKGADLVSLKHSRDDEREADAQGMIFLQNAKVDGKGMITFFKKLNETEAAVLGGAGKTINHSLRFLSTHPLSSERVERLEGLLQQQLNSQQIQQQPLPVTLDELRASS